MYPRVAPIGDAGDGHALDQNEGIALHDHAIRKGAAVALVGIADDVFLLAAVSATVFHLIPVGKPAPPRPRSPDCVTVINHGSGRHLRGAREAVVAAMGEVIVQRARIDDAATRKREPCLVLQIRNLFGFAQTHGCSPPFAATAFEIAAASDTATGHKRSCLARSQPRPSARASAGRASRCARC